MTPKILIVDDDAETRRVLCCVLSPVAAVVEAGGGADALRRIREERPQLVLLDVVMPDLGGLEVLRAALELTPTMSVVMLSGQSDIGVAKTALDRGARAYITKPIDPQELRDVVEDLLDLGAGDGEPDRRRPWRVIG